MFVSSLKHICIDVLVKPFCESPTLDFSLAALKIPDFFMDDLFQVAALRRDSVKKIEIPSGTPLNRINCLFRCALLADIHARHEPTLYVLLKDKQFDEIAELIDDKMVAAFSNIIDKNLIYEFISHCKNKNYVIKLISLSSDITVEHFHMAVKNKVNEEIIHALLSKLKNKIEECIEYVIRVGNVRILKLILEKHNLPEEERILDLAIKNVKNWENGRKILECIKGKYPSLEQREDYHQFLFKGAIERLDFNSVNKLINFYPHLKILSRHILLFYNNFYNENKLIILKNLLDRLINQGDKITFFDLMQFQNCEIRCIETKNKIYKLFVRAFIISNHINGSSVLLPSSDEQFNKQISIAPLQDLLEMYATSSNLLLRSKAEEEGDCTIKCAKGETINAHSSILIKFTDSTSIDLLDFSRKTVGTFLDFLYMGEEELDFFSAEQLLDLCLLSDHLKMEVLSTKCRESLQKLFGTFSSSEFECPPGAESILVPIICKEIKQRNPKDIFFNTEGDKFKNLFLILLKDPSFNLTDLFDLFALDNYFFLEQFMLKCVEIALAFIESRHCPHSQFFPYLFESSLPKEKAKRLEYFVMSLLLIDIYRRKENNFSGIVWEKSNTVLAYKTLRGAYLAKDNSELAISHYKEAADELYPLACFQLAYHYRNGIGIEKNENLAKQYLMQTKGFNWLDRYF
jgi:hypothetical protein